MPIAILQPIQPILQPVEPQGDQTTEQHLLDLADNFKHIVAEKNKKIDRMTRTILKIYGVVMALQDNGDFSYIPTINAILDDEINIIANLD